MLLSSISLSFIVLFLGGFYRAFFILFLKQELAWSQNLILVFGAVFSLLFMPLSLYLIKKIAEQRSFQNIIRGGAMAGLFTILFGFFVPILNFFSILFINIGRSAGSLIANSGRSGLINRRLKEYPEEAGAIDTVFSPLGTALGSLASGLAIAFLGYNFLFILGGLFVLLVTGLVKKFISRAT